VTTKGGNRPLSMAQSLWMLQTIHVTFSYLKVVVTA